VSAMEVKPLLQTVLPLSDASPKPSASGEGAIEKSSAAERQLITKHPEELTAAEDLELVKLKQVARDFEALFIGMLLRSMRETVMESDLFDPEGEGKYYRQLHDDELARRSADQGGGFGVADLIVKQYAARLAAESAYGTEMASHPDQD